MRQQRASPAPPPAAPRRAGGGVRLVQSLPAKEAAEAAGQLLRRSQRRRRQRLRVLPRSSPPLLPLRGLPRHRQAAWLLRADRSTTRRRHPTNPESRAFYMWVCDEESVESEVRVVGRKVQGLWDSTRAASRLSSIAYGWAASGSRSVRLRRLFSIRAALLFARPAGAARPPAVGRGGLGRCDPSTVRGDSRRVEQSSRVESWLTDGLLDSRSATWRWSRGLHYMT